MSGGPCTRSASCRCDDCVAAMGMFSAQDLIAVSSSKVNFDDEAGTSNEQAAPVKQSAPPPSAPSASAPAPAAPRRTGPASTKPADVVEKTQEVAKLPPVNNSDPDEESFDGLSLEEQLTHSNWKARKVGYMTLEQSGFNKDPSLGKYFQTCVEESSMGALDNALDAARVYIQHQYKGEKDGEYELITTSIPILFKKALVGRPGTKQRAIDLVLDMMEVGKPAAKKCLETLQLGLKEKNPKVGQGVLSCMIEACAAFGARKLALDELQQAILTALDAKNPGIKKDATSLAVEVNGWLNGAFKDILAGMIENETQKKGIVKAMEDAKPKDSLTPTRRYRGEAAAAPSGDAGAGQAQQQQGEELNEGEMDEGLFDMLPEKDLIGKLPEINFEKRLKEPKWIERKNALEEATKLCGNPPKLKNGDYGDVVRTCRGILQNDSNQAVVVQTILLLGALGAGLRHEFHIHARGCIPQLLQKYRESKLPLINAVNQGLDSFAQNCVNATEEKIATYVEEAMDSSGDAGKQKSSPLQRQNILAWLDRAFDKGWCWSTAARKASFDKNGFALLLKLVGNCTQDSDPKVRNQATACLANLHKKTKLPETAVDVVEQTIQDLDPKVKAKVTKSSNNTSSKPAGTTTAAAAPAPTKKQPEKTATSSKPSGPPARLKKSATATSKPQASRKTTAAVSSGASALGGNNDNEEEVSGSVMGEEEALEIVQGLDVEGFAEALTSYEEATKWQDKVHVFTLLAQYVESQETFSADPYGNAFLVFLSSKTKQFKEPNFNIMNAAWELAQKVITSCDSPPISKVYANMLLEPGFKKLGDKKQGPVVMEIAAALAEATSPKFIVSRLLKVCDKTTSPKALEDSFTLIQSLVNDFGAATLQVKQIVEYCCGPKGLEARQAPCKNQATACLAAMYHQIGEPIKQLVGDDKMKGPVEAAFEKIGVASSGAFQPKRQLKSAKGEGEEGAAGGAPAVSLDDLMPRTDISSLLTSKLLDDLNDESSKAAWKVRMKAIDDIIDIVQGAKCRIQLTKPVKQSVAELRKRFNDSNRNLVAKAMNAVGLIGNAVGGDGAVSLAKGTGASIFNCLSDGKKTVVLAAEAALENWTVHDNETHRAAFVALINQSPPGLSDAKNDRAVILKWLQKHFPALLQQKGTDEEHEAIAALAPPLVSCLQSKNPTERKLAIACVTEVVNYLGREEGEMAFQNGCRDLKPAVNRTIQPMLKSAFEACGGPPPPSVPSNDNASQDNDHSSHGDNASDAPTRNKKPSKLGQPGKKPVGGKSSNANANAPNKVSPPTSPLPSETAQPYFKDVVPGLRQRREEKGRRRKWPSHFDEKDKVRMDEYVQSLKDDFDRVVNKDLLSMLFTDANKGRAARGSALDPAFQLLMRELPNFGDEAMESFDLLLKWTTIQLLNNNSNVTGNVLQLLEMMFELASGAGYQLSDYEAHAFLPHLVNKLSEKQARFRSSIRTIMSLITNCYPYSKYVPFIHKEIDAQQQRSVYVISECVDELARLARMHGVAVLRIKVGVNQNVLRSIVANVDDSRKEIRNAALYFLEQIYIRDGGDSDVFFKHFKQYKVNLSDKCKVLIENHIASVDKSSEDFHGMDHQHEEEQQHYQEEEEASRPVSRNLRLQQQPQHQTPGRLSREPATAIPNSSRLKPPSPRTPEPGDSAHMRVQAGMATPSTKLFDMDLPDTPPSPSDRKRLKTPGGPDEKENDPNTDATTPMFQRTAGSEIISPIKYVRMIGSIQKDAQAYLGLIRSNKQTPQSMEIRDKGIKALALLGSKEPPSGWIESRLGGQKEWISLLRENMECGGVTKILLDLVNEVTTKAEPPSVYLEGANLTVAQSENRLLKLVLPAVFTVAWWPELRNAVDESDPVTATRWVSCTCDLIGRLMFQKSQSSQEGAVHGSEEVYEIESERDRLLKTSQTIFAKLSESPAWLPAILNRMRKCNELIRSVKGGDSDRIQSEKLLKRVLRSALTEFVALQESYIEPYHGINMTAFAHAANDLLALGLTDADPDHDEDLGVIELLVNSVLRGGNRFLTHLPKTESTELVSLRSLVARLLLQVGHRAKATTGSSSSSPPSSPSSIPRPSGLPPSSPPRSPPVAATGRSSPTITDDDKAHLSQIFSRISEAINSTNTSMRDEAIADLFRFDDSHPGFDAKAYLGDSSAWFQQYICEELEKRRQEKKRGGTITGASNAQQIVSEGSVLKSTNIRASNPLGETTASAANIPITTSIRERLGKLRKGITSSTKRSTVDTTTGTLKGEANSPEKLPPVPPKPASLLGASSTNDVAKEESQNVENNMPPEIQVATDTAAAVAKQASSTLLNIRERIAARKNKLAQQE